ncbi:MAG: hypothetical protein JSS87_08055 [Acidobacteria bacterium]|nr:hypothetical protein [Acidobacteriota bacterium]
MHTSAHLSEVRLTPAEVEALDARRRRGQLLMTISLQTACVTALVALLFVGQDLTYSPGWNRPMFYWASITGLISIVTFLIGLRLRRGNYEFTSY